jgi:hypothetical protein
MAIQVTTTRVNQPLIAVAKQNVATPSVPSVKTTTKKENAPMTASLREAKAAASLATMTPNGIVIDVRGREGLNKCHLAGHSNIQRFAPVKGDSGMQIAVRVPDGFVLTDTILIPSNIVNAPSVWRQVERSQGQVTMDYATLECAEAGHAVTITLRQKHVNPDVVATVQQMKAIASVQPAPAKPVVAKPVVAKTAPAKATAKAKTTATAKPRAKNGQFVATASQTQAVPAQSSLTAEQIDAIAKAFATVLASYRK